jgi:hypothetical protein
MNFHLSGPEEKVTRAVRVLFLETFQRRHFFLETSDQKAEREREKVRERGGRTTFFWYRSDANCFPKHGNMGPSPVNVTLTLPVT